MKKLLMLSALLVLGANSFATSSPAKQKTTMATPINVSLDVVQTSQLVLMDGSKQLTSIELKHPQILLSSAKTTTTPSVVSQNFRVQTGDNTTIQVGGANATQIDYSLEGVTNNTLVLKSGVKELNSTLSLDTITEGFTAGVTEGLANKITSTIDPVALNGLTTTGTYSGTATLKVVVQ